MLSYMRGKKYLQRKLSDGRPEKGAKNAPLKTKDILANELNVSSRTIMNDAKFTQAVDTIAETSPELKDEIQVTLYTKLYSNLTYTNTLLS